MNYFENTSKEPNIFWFSAPDGYDYRAHVTGLGNAAITRRETNFHGAFIFVCQCFVGFSPTCFDIYDAANRRMYDGKRKALLWGIL